MTTNEREPKTTSILDIWGGDKGIMFNNEAPNGDTQEDDLTVADPLEVDTQQRQITPAASQDTQQPTQHDWEKRYKDSRKLDDARVKTIQQLEAKLKEQESKPDLSKLKTEEEIEAFRMEAPDAYAVLESIAIKKVSEASKEYKDKLDAFTQDQQKLAGERIMAEVAKAHSDAFDIRDEIVAYSQAKAAGIEFESKFTSWFETQTKAVKSLIESDDPRDIVEGLNLYKKSTGIKTKATQDKKKEAAEAATSISTSKGIAFSEPKRQWLESEIAKLKGNELSRYMKHIEEAQREGRITYDMRR